jgi:hypothetical protein
VTVAAIVEAAGPQRSKSPAVRALADHAKTCPRCSEARRLGLPLLALCPGGRTLAFCATRARARRAVVS